MNFFEKNPKGDLVAADIIAENPNITLYLMTREVRHNPWI